MASSDQAREGRRQPKEHTDVGRLRGLGIFRLTGSWGFAALHPRLYADTRFARSGPKAALPQHSTVSLRLTVSSLFDDLRLRRRFGAQPRRFRLVGKAEPFRLVLRQSRENDVR